MPKKNDFKLDVVSVRLVKDAPIYSEHTFNNPADIAAVMGDCMCQFDREVVCVVNLRSDLKPINVHFASVGSLNEAMAHPRELFKSSILSNAASMMLIHCHPSGNVFPSKADTMMTDRMNKLCELMGIPLIDHIIVGGDNREFFSFREKGMIDNPKITLSTDYRTLDIKLDCQHFFRQIFLGYFSDIVQAFDTLRKNVCGDDYTSLHNPIVLSSVLPAYGMFHSIQILFL